MLHYHCDGLSELVFWDGNLIRQSADEGGFLLTYDGDILVMLKRVDLLFGFEAILYLKLAEI